MLSKECDQLAGITDFALMQKYLRDRDAFPVYCPCRLLLIVLPTAAGPYSPGVVVDPLSAFSPTFTIQMPLWVSLK